MDWFQFQLLGTFLFKFQINFDEMNEGINGNIGFSIDKDWEHSHNLCFFYKLNLRFFNFIIALASDGSTTFIVSVSQIGMVKLLQVSKPVDEAVQPKKIHK